MSKIGILLILFCLIKKTESFDEFHLLLLIEASKAYQIALKMIYQTVSGIWQKESIWGFGSDF